MPIFLLKTRYKQLHRSKTWAKGYKKFHAISEFFLIINVKMPTIVGTFTFMSRKNRFLGLSEPENAELLEMFILMTYKILCSAELSMAIFIPSGPA